MLSAMRSFTLNGTVPTWPTCLACALTDRTFSYTTSNRTSTCQACFDTWCWSGVDNTTTPSGEYEPVVGSVPSFLVTKGLTSTGGSSSAAPGSTATATVSGSNVAATSSKASSAVSSSTQISIAFMSVMGLGALRFGI